ncbi:MAG: Holliday junction branch migration helicase RuvB [Actinomycetota bacterium]|jgi:Holliday junction DNA helicase RuvB
MSEDITSPLQLNDDVVLETVLRPKKLDEFIGQIRVREQLNLVLKASMSRNTASDHILLSGPPGLGKTTLAQIVAHELGVPIRITSGPAITHAGDLAAVLSSLMAGEILFIDEIHRIAKPAAELLYVAMEDFRVDIMIGKGVGATAIPLELPPFTLIGATTRSGLLPAPLRDRFGFTAHLDFYDPEDLQSIVHRSASLMQVVIDDESALEIGSRSRGTPRIANRLLRRVRDYSEVNKQSINIELTQSALELYEVDALGLDRLDLAVLSTLIEKFSGGPVGLNTLAMAIGEDSVTIEEVVEPFLVRLGFIARTPRGRQATLEGWRHVGLNPPDSSTLF